MREMWDQRYASEELVYGKEPNSFFKEFIDTNKSGSLLLPAEGEGRNAIYAISKGWKVFAVDYSEVAKNKALQRASSLGLSMNYEVADLSQWEFAKRVDNIALIYAHFAPEYRQTIHKKLMKSLNPGGRIVLEAFTREQLKYNTGGPKKVDWLYDSKMMENDFKGLNFEVIEEKLIQLNEGPYHNGKASIIRMIGIKK